MLSLIITIIGIALIAIAAIMGAFYGGTAFEQGQINADAASIISTSQQILAASRIWATNHNQPDVSGMPNGVADSQGYGVMYAVGIGGGIGALVADNELTSWPTLAGGQIPPAPVYGAYNSPTTATATTGTYDNGTYNLNGYQAPFFRWLISYKNGNYVSYSFWEDNSYGVSYSTTNYNHPILQIARSINNSLKQIPSNANMTALGVPNPPNAFTLFYASGYTKLNLEVDSSGNLQTNYCYLGDSNRVINCVFGPS